MMAETQAIAAPRQYETIYVLRPDAGREASENISTRVLDVISKQHGSLTRVENWGYRKLAYPVRKHGRGVYVYLKYVGDGALVSELERNLRLQDVVLKFQTVKISNDAGAVAAQPEAVEFEHLDVLEEAEPEDSMARALGLEDVRDDMRMHDRDSADTDLDDEDAAEGTDEAEERA
jgi:small subunit ribosomal protein S6